MLVHPSLLQRKIIHFDMDAFYASVEIRDDPDLKGRPVVVGGSPDSRAVVCTASYEARKFGIHSAMSCAQARRLCPQAIFLRPHFEKYQAASQQIHQIFKKYTPLIEPLSLDEAYLDVTDNAGGFFAVKIARLIQEEILAKLRLSGSAGVAPNKLVAKIASDIRKPAGLTVILPHQVRSFMAPLPLRKIHGVGPVTEQRLAAAGLQFCRDIWPYSPEQLQEKVGSLAGWLYDGAQGIDGRPVSADWVRKSLGREETFQRDLLDLNLLERELYPIVDDVADQLLRRNLKGRTITLKVRYDDFKRITRSHTLLVPTDDRKTIGEIARELLGATDAGRRKIRLLGVSISNLLDEEESASGFSPLLRAES